MPRRATRDVVLHGATIREGEEVSLVWGAANHDERRFPDPERFDIHRDDNRHLALGPHANRTIRQTSGDRFEVLLRAVEPDDGVPGPIGSKRVGIGRRRNHLSESDPLVVNDPRDGEHGAALQRHRPSRAQAAESSRGSPQQDLVRGQIP